ncbi:MAG: hypothetical protein D6722_11985, partial [Bacteroidetes bacterium]
AAKIALINRKWTRYWLLKYMEQEDIQLLDALVLDTNPRSAHLLLPDFLMEIHMPMDKDRPVRAGEMIRIRVEKLLPREDVLRVQLV